MTTLPKLYGDQYAAAGEAAEAWKAAHEEARQVCEFEEIVRICLDLHPHVVRMVKNAWSRGFAGGVDKPERLGRQVLESLRRVGSAWLVLEDVGRLYTDLGYSLDDADRVRATRDEVRRMMEDFASRWPFANQEEIERGRREIEAGRFVTGEELLRELQGEAGPVD
jgi:predicted transcriptional regulator